MRQQSCCDLGLRQQGTCGQGLPLAASWGLVLRALHPGSGNSIRNSIRVLLVSIYKLCRFFAMSSSERASVPESMSRACLWSGSGSRAGAACNHREVSPGVSTDVQVALDRILPDLHLAISSMKQAADPEDLRKGITEIFQLVEEAWVMPTLGRDVAKALCDVIRLEGGLDLLLNLLQATELETKCQASQLLEQILQTFESVQQCVILCFLPGCRWSHEYQEATIEKIIRFLQGRSSRDSSAGSENSLECAAPLGQTYSQAVPPHIL